MEEHITTVNEKVYHRVTVGEFYLGCDIQAGSLILRLYEKSEINDSTNTEKKENVKIHQLDVAKQYAKKLNGKVEKVTEITQVIEKVEEIK